MADDWMRDYEADRRAVAAGNDTGTSKRHDDEAALAAAYYGGSASGVPGSGASDAPEPKGYPTDFDVADPRFDLEFVPLPPGLKQLFGDKVGRLLYWCNEVDMYYKGFFSPNKTPAVLFVTPLCLWIGCPKTGALVIGKSWSDIQSILLMSAAAVGVRCQRGHDLFLKVEKGRTDLANVIRKLTRSGAPASIVDCDGSREKSYRSEIAYVEQDKWSYELVEDPRTGLPLVQVPEKHHEHYGPLVPKLLHWFGGCNQVTLDARGVTHGIRRGGWVTPTCLFLSAHTGPQPDGRDIVRCIAIEYVSCVVNGPGFAIAVCCGTGPPQPDCIIDFDDAMAKQCVLFALERCYSFRKGQPLNVRQATNFATVKIADEARFKPELYRMKTRDDLYGLLRTATC